MTETEVGYGIVGAGRLGSAIAGRLAAGGATGLICSRRPQAAAALAEHWGWRAVPGLGQLVSHSELVLLCVPDAELSPLVPELARLAVWKGRVAAHCSGSQGLALLRPLAQRGGATGVFHPLAPVPDGDPRCLEGTFVSIEAEPTARPALRELASRLGCRVIELDGPDRSLYHAAAVFAGVLPVLLERLAERLGHLASPNADLTEGLRALHLASAHNVGRLGPQLGLSGPQQRQDQATVRSHLEALDRVDPVLAQLYTNISEAARTVPADPTEAGG
ncbi:MAG: Rossmann-like and DUF2520 domain-containing protein [Candidatus Dormibacteria bacterium]